MFSKLDANSGFWQVPLSKECRLLTTFITPFGRFCFNRLPLSISSALERFQRRMREILTGQEGGICHMDDVLLFVPSQKAHNAGLCASARVMLSTLKYAFLEHCISEDGVQPDEHALDTMQQLPVLLSKKDLQRLPGMVMYVSHFVPDLADLLAPLTEMLSN